MIKKQKKWVVILCMIASLFTSISLKASLSLYKDALEQQEPNAQEHNSALEIMQHQEAVIIHNKDFACFLSAIVEAANQTGNRAMLSQALLRCYDTLNTEQKIFYLKDLQEAMPEFLEIVEMYQQAHRDEVRAPRPGTIPANAIVGPGSCDLSSVVNLLHQLLSVFNKCCDTLSSDFQQTWTILADLSSNFTAIIDVTTNISSNFQQTFTILADIKNTLTECCENITSEFQQTWTILDGIVITATVDFSEVFSVIADIKKTVTACCENITSEFQATWSIIAALSTTVTVDFSSVFTVIDDIKSTVTSCCSTVFTNFQNTWTILESLGCGCVTTPITQELLDANGGTLTLTSPGNYVLAENITSTGAFILTIASNNVTLDLCNRSITGNGSTTSVGIFVNPNLTNINILNGAIYNMITDGVRIISGVNKFLVSNIRTFLCQRSGINVTGTAGSIVSTGIIENCQAELCATRSTGLAGLFLSNVNNIVVSGGQYNNNGAAGVTTQGAGIFLSTATSCIVSNASMSNNVGINAAGLVLSGTGNVIESCYANDSLATATAVGFKSGPGNGNYFNNCVASRNTGASGYGFWLSGGELESVIYNCSAESNSGSTPFSTPRGIFGAGIFVEGFSGAVLNQVQNCTVVANNQSGIFDNQLTFNGVPAIGTGPSRTLVVGNTAVENGLAGPAFATSVFRNYTVAYAAGGVPVQFVSLRFVSGTFTVSTNGNTMLSNIDARNA